MDSRLTRAGSSPGRPGRRSQSWFDSLGVLGRIVAWLAALVQLTDEQQDEAGVYLGHRRRR